MHRGKVSSPCLDISWLYSDKLAAESNLDTHDVAFSLGETSHHESTFRMILVSGHEGWSSQSERIERLRMLNGGRLMAVICLLNGDKAATAFAQ